MRTANPEKTAERRRQILTAALICFRKKGFHGATMSSICKEAKMSPGHLYHYFSSKEDLIEAIVDEDRKTADLRIKEISETTNTLDTLINGVHKMWEGKLCVGGALNAEIIAEATRNKRIAAIVMQRNQHIRSILTHTFKNAQAKGHIAKDLDPEGFAILFMGLAEGLTAMADADPNLEKDKVTKTIQMTWKKTLTPIAD